ncbi:MAG: hypothetical protein AAGC68_17905, partial [Verrucomicrobiota bacterium]
MSNQLADFLLSLGNECRSERDRQSDVLGRELVQFLTENDELIEGFVREKKKQNSLLEKITLEERQIGRLGRVFRRIGRILDPGQERRRQLRDRLRSSAAECSAGELAFWKGVRDLVSEVERSGRAAKIDSSAEQLTDKQTASARILVDLRGAS